MNIRTTLILLPLLLGSCGVVKKNHIERHNEQYTRQITPGETRFQILWSQNHSDQIYLEPAQLESARPVLMGDELLVSYSSGLVATFGTKDGVQRRKVDFPGTAIGEIFPVNRDEVIFFASDGALYRFTLKGDKVVWQTRLENEQVISKFLKYNNLLIFKTSKERLYGVDLKTGEVAWLTRSYQSDSSFTIANNLSPVLAGDQVIAGFANGKLVLFDGKSGKSTYELTISAKELFNEIVSSCVVSGSVIYIPSFQKGIVAFDYKLKTVLWESKLPAFTRLQLQKNGSGLYFSGDQMVFIDLKTGKIKGKYTIDIPHPHTLELLNDRYLLLGSHRGGLTLIDLKVTPYKAERFYISSGISHIPEIKGDNLYLLSNSGYLYRIKLVKRGN